MRIVTNEITLDTLFQQCSARIEKIFSHYLTTIPSLELKIAIEYTLFNGGKHIRPLLVYASGCIFNATWENLDIPACAIEMLHTYSLIHDDLPCMDNADLRRGKPSCHKAFGGGIALLTGDALQSLAMQIIATHPAPNLKADKRIQMIKLLSEASGLYGMVSGQTMDLTIMNDKTISPDLLLSIYRLKTGALLSASVELGRLASSDNDEINEQALIKFGENIGLAFQLQDDVLDMETESSLSGKPKNHDLQNNKVTYPRLVGLAKTKDKVEELYEKALEAINYLGNRAQLLRELTGYLLQRKK